MNIDKIETESITRVARTDKDVDNSIYELKQLYSYTDDYGNKGTFYKKDEVPTAQFEAQLQERKAAIAKELEEIAAKEEKIKSLPKDVVKK